MLHVLYMQGWDRPTPGAFNIISDFIPERDYGSIIHSQKKVLLKGAMLFSCSGSNLYYVSLLGHVSML